MRILLQREETFDSLLDKLSRAAFAVVDDNLPESHREDVRVGIYVALSHILAAGLVCGPDCDVSPACQGMRETSPLDAPIGKGQAAN